MVAVHRIESHAERIRERRGELDIPGKCAQIETVGESDEPAVPVVYVHVPGVDSVVGKHRRTLFRTLFDAGETRRVDDHDIRVTPSHVDDLLELVMAQPELVERKTVPLSLGNDALGSFDILHVDADIDEGFHGPKIFRECRHMGRQIDTVYFADGHASEPASDHTVVIENDLAVLRDPRIRFHSARTELDGQLESMDGVLNSMCPGASVGKRNRVFATSGQALLHAGRIRPQSYAGRVFNLSGSEIIFLLLAGLVVLGPERLPGVIRTVGRIYGQVRGIAQGLEKEIKDTFAEPVSDLRNTAQQIRTGFGEVDTEPSPPMRPEMARNPDPEPEAPESQQS